MKQFFKMFFASALAIIITSMVMFFLILSMIMSATKSMTSESVPTISNNSILVLDVNKPLHEQSENNSLAAFSDENSFTEGVYDLIKTIEFAKGDDHVKGIFMKVSGSPNGWATMQQVRAALEDFKTSGKFIYAYAEGISQRAYYIANVADSVYVNPVGGFEFKGLVSQIPFFKGTLDMLNVQPEIFYAGKFKSATEPFRADKMSEPNKEQIRVYQNGIWNNYLKTVSEKTGMDSADLQQLASSGAIQFPSDALKNKFVDGLLYWDQVEQKMKDELGLKENDRLLYKDMDDYGSYVKTKRSIKEDKIAILFAEGDIVDGESFDNYQIASKNLSNEIRKIKNNSRIKAVVLRINSGGGSALASEVILRELQLLRAKKPVIVSMGDVAASGGYYIACQADSIFAMPNTITGSIGVFTMLFNAENLLKNKFGITFDEVKNGDYADFPTVTRPLTAAESQKMQAGVDTIYETFKSRVAKARNKSMEYIDSIAQGRVWTGEDALSIGLIDGLGDINRALESAARKSNISNYQVVTYPEPVDPFQNMIKRLKKSGVSSSVIKSAMEEDFQQEYQWLKSLSSLYKMNGKAQMMMPFRLIDNR